MHAARETGSKVSVDIEFGGLNTLICGENANSLAQFATSLDSPVVHVASWPGNFGEGMVVGGAIDVNGRRDVVSSVGCCDKVVFADRCLMTGSRSRSHGC